MGNCCGKPAGEGNFQGEGRTLGSTPANAPRASTKASVPTAATKGSSKPQVGGPGRTVGGGNAEDDPQLAARRAAELRNTGGSKPKSDLERKLDAQKKQTHNQLMQSAASENRLQREADQATEARNYN